MMTVMIPHVGITRCVAVVAVDDVIAMVEGKRDTTASAADGFYATAAARKARESADSESTIDLADLKQYLS